MDIKIDVKPEDIEKAVVDAVVQSSIGEKIKSHVNTALSNYTLQDAIKTEVNMCVRDMIREYLLKDETVRERILEEIKRKLTDDVVSRIVARTLEDR